MWETAWTNEYFVSWNEKIQSIDAILSKYKKNASTRKYSKGKLLHHKFHNNKRPQCQIIQDSVPSECEEVLFSISKSNSLSEEFANSGSVNEFKNKIEPLLHKHRSNTVSQRRKACSLPTDSDYVVWPCHWISLDKYMYVLLSLCKENYENSYLIHRVVTLFH